MEFVEPPPEKNGQRSARWREIAATLKENPGKWGIVGNFSPGVATSIRRGQYKAFWPADQTFTPTEAQVYMKQHWEVTTRKTDKGSRNDVYVRWLG